MLAVAIILEIITLVSVIGLSVRVSELEQSIRLKDTILGDDDDIGNKLLEDGKPVVSKPTKKKAVRQTTTLKKAA